MTDKLQNKILKWNDKESRETNLKIDHLEKRLYCSYEPAQLPNPHFRKRLERWLENVSGNEADEKLLFNSIVRLFYIGPEEFTALYRFAYNNIVARWLIDKVGLMLDDEDITNKLYQAVLNTWFCPITDSMRINAFHHVNDIPSEINYRPDWLSLEKFGSEEKIRKYISKNKIEYLVLLEDFVGGGNQISKAIKFANNFSDITSILIVPLIICPEGMTNIVTFANKNNIEFSPTLPIKKEAFIPEIPISGESIFIRDIRDLAYNTYKKVSGGVDPGAIDSKGKPIKPYHPLGWDKTGGMVIMYSNTPDNTLPLYHWESADWTAIFPRHARV